MEPSFIFIALGVIGLFVGLWLLETENANSLADAMKEQRQRNDQLDQRLESARDVITTSREEQNRLANQNATLRIEIEDSQKFIGELQAQLADARREVNRLHELVKTLQNDLVLIKQDNAWLGTQWDNVCKEKEKLSAELVRCWEEANNLRAELATFENERQFVNTLLASANSEKDALSSGLSVSSAALINACSERDRFHSKFLAADAAVRSLENKLAEYHHCAERAKEYTGEINQKLAAAQSEVKSANELVEVYRCDAERERGYARTKSEDYSELAAETKKLCDRVLYHFGATDLWGPHDSVSHKTQTLCITLDQFGRRASKSSKNDFEEVLNNAFNS